MQQLASALLVEVPESEPYVREIRSAYDPYARRGIPAHITLLYPFVPPAQLTNAIHRELRELFAGVAPFEFELSEVRWFGETTIYLGLRDEAAFHSVTQQIFRQFPGYPPYGDAQRDSPPHLTLGAELTGGQLERLQESPAMRTLPLPIVARANRATLMVERVDRWVVAERFRLGSAS